MNRVVELGQTLLEVCRVAQAFSRVERIRCRQGPLPAVELLRRRARLAPQRDAIGRRCLRRAICWVDACMPKPGNCYRKALLEIALDRGAAADPLVLGFTLHGEQLSGHAWLASDARPEDYHFSVPI